MAKTKYMIPVTFEMCGMIAIEADSAEEAIELAEEHMDELPIPEYKEYVDGSYDITKEPEIVQMYTDEPDNHKYHPEYVALQEERS